MGEIYFTNPGQVVLDVQEVHAAMYFSCQRRQSCPPDGENHTVWTLPSLRSILGHPMLPPILSSCAVWMAVRPTESKKLCRVNPALSAGSFSIVIVIQFYWLLQAEQAGEGGQQLMWSGGQQMLTGVHAKINKDNVQYFSQITKVWEKWGKGNMDWCKYYRFLRY